MHGAANLSSAGGIAALGGGVDFMNNISRHANLGGLGGLGINTSGHSMTGFDDVNVLVVTPCLVLSQVGGTVLCISCKGCCVLVG